MENLPHPDDYVADDESLTDPERALALFLRLRRRLVHHCVSDIWDVDIGSALGSMNGVSIVEDYQYVELRRKLFKLMDRNRAFTIVEVATADDALPPSLSAIVEPQDEWRYGDLQMQLGAAQSALIQAVARESESRSDPQPNEKPRLEAGQGHTALAVAQALFLRARQIVELYCTGYVICPSPRLDWCYILCRKGVLDQDYQAPEFASLDRVTIADALPESLSGLTSDAVHDVWELGLRQTLDQVQGQFLAACATANVNPFDSNTDQQVGAFGVNWLDGAEIDELISQYEAEKRQVERLFLERSSPEFPSRSSSTKRTSLNRAQRRKQENSERARHLREQGRTIKEIARELQVSERTVSNYISNDD